MFIFRYIYVPDIVGAYFRNHLAVCMKNMGYTLCLDNPDLWKNPMVSPDYGFSYWAYIICFVDKILCIDNDIVSLIDKLNK